MRIGVVGSMNKAEELFRVRDALGALGHETSVTPLAEGFLGKSQEERDNLKEENKRQRDAIRVFWEKMKTADALVVCNVLKDGIEGYIGGNTFLEIGFAHVLGEKIFILNPLPQDSPYLAELEEMGPICIFGDLSKIG